MFEVIDFIAAIALLPSFMYFFFSLLNYSCLYTSKKFRNHCIISAIIIALIYIYIFVRGFVF